MEIKEHTYWAKEILGFLVNHVRDFKGGDKFITYGMVAKADDYPAPHTGNLFGNNIGKTLSVMGHMFDSMNIDGVSVPMIQALVVGSNTKLPSVGLKEFNPTYEFLTADKKKDFFQSECRKIFEFGDRWEEVLNRLGIKKSEKSEENKKKTGGLYNPYGSEGSPEHRDLRDYIAANPSKIGISIDVKGITEYPLKSGDSIDVVFEDDNSVVAVEVKSERSGNDDIERGLYQCIKYAEVLKAEDRVNKKSREISCVLVLAEGFPSKLKKIRNILGITVHAHIVRS
jgi:hypothetical protein